jgi:hypothetical protein
VFNDFQTEYIEFNRDKLMGYLKRKCEECENGKSAFNEKTVTNDINVFIKNYLRPAQRTKSIEDDFSALLIDLNLLKIKGADEIEAKTRYSLESDDRDDIPWQLVLFLILDFTSDTLISFTDLLTKPNCPRLVFAMTPDGLDRKIKQLVNENQGIHFTDQYGIREIQFENRPDKWEVLRSYYGRN